MFVLSICWLIAIVSIFLMAITGDYSSSVNANLFWIVFGSLGVVIELCQFNTIGFCKTKFCQLMYGCEIPYWICVIIAGLALFGFHPVVIIYTIVVIQAIVVGINKRVG